MTELQGAMQGAAFAGPGDGRDAGAASAPQVAAPSPGSTGVPMGPAIPPLNVTGLVVRKADLVVALRLYVPQLADIRPLDSERFVLSLVPPADEGAR